MENEDGSEPEWTADQVPQAKRVYSVTFSLVSGITPKQFNAVYYHDPGIHPLPHGPNKRYTVAVSTQERRDEYVVFLRQSEGVNQDSIDIGYNQDALSQS